MDLDAQPEHGGACILCGHDPACGLASITVGKKALSEGRLCHTDSHSCYHAWTVYGMRKLEGVNLDGLAEPCHHPYWKQLPGGQEVCQRCGADVSHMDGMGG